MRLFLQCGQSNAEVSLDFVSEKPGCLTLSIGGATLCYTFDQYIVISCIQKKSRVIVCQNSCKLVQALRRCGQSDVVASGFIGPATLYILLRLFVVNQTVLVQCLNYSCENVEPQCNPEALSLARFKLSPTPKQLLRHCRVYFK